MQLKQKLTDFLNNYEKLCILTIGNELCSDDAIGVILSKKLSLLTKKRENIIIINGGIAPENFTSKIRQEKPTHIIIIDAIETNEKPGTIISVNKKNISNYNVSTHTMPISFLINYLEFNSSFKILLIGIQPKNLDLGTNLTPEVENAVNKLFMLFKQILLS